MTQYWKLGPGDVDSTQFFQLLPIHFPDATTMYVEGTSIESDVRALFEASVEEGEYLPGAQTIWPKSTKYRCRFSAALCEQLARVSLHHAEPELFDHVFLYAGEDALIEWPDAFGYEMYIRPWLIENRVSHFAHLLGLPYEMHKDG